MKIGILCYPTYGGSGIVATELGMQLAKKGNEIHFISYSLPARLDITQPNIFFHQVNIQPYPLFQYQPYSLALSSTIVEITKKHQLDLIHVHYAIPHAYATYIAKQILMQEGIQLPLMTTLHGTDITLVGKHPAYQPAVEFSINQSDSVTTVSESLKKDTLDVFCITKDIRVIPNFIDLSLFNPKNNCVRKNFAEDHEKILIHVSNLRKVKRIQDVLDIFEKVNQKIPSKLIIVGEGPESETINHWIEENNYQDKVKLMGKTQDLYHILCVSDLFLLPSEQESFGLAALEAMAAGVPVISSNAGGIPEVNIDGLTGFVSPVGNTDDMTHNALQLLENDSLLNIFKHNARQRAEEFEMNAIVPLYEKEYQKLVHSA